MNGCAVLVNDRGECSRDFERFGRVDNFATMREDSEQAEDKTEAVEEGRWAAENVGRGEAHSVADEAGIVYNVTLDVSTLTLQGKWVTYWWVSMAAFGRPVVPLVNCKLTT